MKILVAGIGSTILGDDGAGVIAARQLAERALPPGVEVIELGTAGLSLLDHVEGFDRLIVLDAIVTGAPPGTVHVLSGDAVSTALHLGPGHDADLPTTLTLGKKLVGRGMPEEVLVVAVEARDVRSFSEDLTPAVLAAIPEVIETVERLLTTGQGSS